MLKKLASVLFVLLAATVLLAWPATDLVAQTETVKPKVVTKSTGHPEKQTTAVAVHQTTKPKPASKAEEVPKAPRASTSWVPGDYYWGGDDWQWDHGYWLDQPWSGATWIPGHWSERWWGWTWVPGYWY